MDDSKFKFSEHKKPGWIQEAGKAETGVSSAGRCKAGRRQRGDLSLLLGAEC